MTKKNRLAIEKSPYLLQHRHNPVHWYAWGEEAIQAAKLEDKVIFLSIGYSTCYWCHVMEKDSFEIQEVADILNQHFICIKVDREERPDIDEIYMDALVAMSGHGGWPMSVFLTPDAKPFFGGTYFPRKQFIALLAQIQNAWINKREQVIQSGAQLFAHIKTLDSSDSVMEIPEDIFNSTFLYYQRTFDSKFGGFGQAPKFPQAVGISFLLRLSQRSQNSSVQKMATHTLDCMACGGIFDHLGGGFHRYSTDERWLVPHFEKMLYDNALLSAAYLEAWQATKKKDYQIIARETLDYVLREMTDTKGGFYSAQDAGEVGKEGEFYVWDYHEIKRILTPDEFAEFSQLYPLTEQGNFEDNKNILHLIDIHDWPKRQNSLILSAREKLLSARNTRPAPHIDDKILTSWNGLMVAAFAKGYQATQESKYLFAAQNCAKFLKQNLWTGALLLRRYRDSESRISGMLEDYAYLIHGLLVLYECDFDTAWIDWACELQNAQDRFLADAESGAYFTCDSSDTNIIYRKKDSHDGAQPSGNSMSALNLLRLFAFTKNQDFQNRYEKIMRYLGAFIRQYQQGHAQALIALDFARSPAKEIAIVGDKKNSTIDKALAALRENFLPNTVVAVGNDGLPLLSGKPFRNDLATIYVCEQGACQAPTQSIETMLRQVRDWKKIELVDA